jgi:hypothetical protein
MGDRRASGAVVISITPGCDIKQYHGGWEVCDFKRSGRSRE